MSQRPNLYIEKEATAFAADPIVKKMSREQLEKCIENTNRQMLLAKKNFEYMQAAQYRDELFRLQALLKEKVM